MTKPAPGVRLLRSLARAGKAQRKLLASLLTAAKPKPRKAPPQAGKLKATPGIPASLAPAPRPRARTSTPTAQGKWLASHFPDLLQTGSGPRIDYWLYLPADVPENGTAQGWPLVVMLHGCRQSATQFAQGTRMNLLADAKGYAVLYPQQPVSAHAQRCWRWFSEAAQMGGGEAQLLAALVGSVCERYDIDRRRIYACGISAGAGMAAALALNYPELIAAVGLHSGPVFGAARNAVEAMHVMRHGASQTADDAIRSLMHRRAGQPGTGQAGPALPMPALLVQGENDQVVRPVNQRQLARQWLQLNGLPAETLARVIVKHAGRGKGRSAYEIRDYIVGRKVLLRVASVAGLGHAWSGGDPAIKFHAQTGPNASRMMLDFFGSHRR